MRPCGKCGEKFKKGDCYIELSGIYHLECNPFDEIAKLKAERAQLVALANFGEWCFDEFWADRLLHVNDEDGNDIADQIEKLGLIVEVDADIQAHWVPSQLAKLPEGIE